MLQLAYLLAQFQYFVCPVGYNSETYRFTVECEPSELFILQEYTLPAVVQNALGKVGLGYVIPCYPFHNLPWKEGSILCFPTPGFLPLAVFLVLLESLGQGSATKFGLASGTARRLVSWLSHMPTKH